MLRIDGTNLNIDRLLEIDLKPDSFYKKGEYRTKKSNHTSSGARYLVSNADFSNFEDQKKDAIRFLRDNANSIKMIMSIPDLEGAGLDFGINKRDVLVQSDSFPAELAKLAGELGIDIELSQYPESEEKKKGEQE
jgi:hypothetical protein